jgi:dTDP-4-dehydrorhamnose 3,5-epimerase
MEVVYTGIEGLLLIKPRVFGDERGYFVETYNRETFFRSTGQNIEWKQDNESGSSKGVLRGMHFQLPPRAQDKLVRVSRGSVFDVAVDIRSGSPTYGHWYGVTLSAENKWQLLVPKGFAHGFQVLEDNTVFVYKCSDTYSPESERNIRWNDADVGIAWPLDEPVLSERDSMAPLLREIQTPF